MKNMILKTTLTSIMLYLTFSFTNGQCVSEVVMNVNNGSFEEWGNEGGYIDIAGDYWDTANRTALLGVDENVTESSDAHTGNASAKLETSNWLNNVTSATVFTGSFIPNVLDPPKSIKFGKPYPFTNEPELPTNFRVWYKYFPVEGDSAEVYTYLTKWTGTDTIRVASAYTKLYDEKTEWTLLDIPFTGNSTEMPDTIICVFASSSRGDILQGQIGNTLFIDDVEYYNCLTNTTHPMMSEVEVNAFPNPVNNGQSIRFELSEQINGLIRVFSNDGKEVISNVFEDQRFDMDITQLNSAFYRFVVYDNESTSAIASGSFVVE